MKKLIISAFRVPHLAKPQNVSSYTTAEFDEDYFTVESSEIEQEKGVRGRSAVGNEKVAIMTDSIVLEDVESGKKSTQYRYFKAKVLTDYTAEQINLTIQGSIDEKILSLQIKVRHM